MAARIILRYPATCRDCGATLPAGAEAKYYGRGRVYGINCHAKSEGKRDGLQAMTDLDGQYEGRCNDWARENL